ncbi:carbamoyltransferase [Patescibacteria group bacterium]|nr:carbamoyltransferase [Patescibacteria group bacterium]MBU1124165.1 carbamoyltransferase [Patescibacteria group bacterium]MBU1911851.1 carbamoyltransferase [Patescibacteria group bacterium]
MSPVYILGISCYYHDSAAVLLKDGEIIFAAQEERYTRKKHDDDFPINAINTALEFAGITVEDLSAVAFYEKPFTKFFDRILKTLFKVWPLGFMQYQYAMQDWMTKKLWIPQNIKKELNYKGEIFFIPHHESHAWSSFGVSGFEDSTIVTVDGVGEWATATIGSGQCENVKSSLEGHSSLVTSHSSQASVTSDQPSTLRLRLEERPVTSDASVLNNIPTVKILKEIHYPHSLGLLYSAITYYLGFKVNSAEYKVMGLAPYGEPKYLKQMRHLIDVKEDGSFALNMKYFSFEHGLRMTNRRLEKLLGEPKRKPESELEQFHKDIARSLQDMTEEIMMKIVSHAKEIAPSQNLCLAGGVALNCVANGKILRSGLFENIYIQPASGDAGGALGAALGVWYKKFAPATTESRGFPLQRMEHSSFGDEFSDEEIEKYLKKEDIPFYKMSDEGLIDRVSTLLEGDNVIGWFQGRMEYGPRALGNRSIIADARNKDNWQKVNMKIKFRESFRPFAPTALEESASKYFDLNVPSPFMLLVADVHPDQREKIPAVTHVDGSARIQTVNRDQNERYYDLIKAFECKTGCGVIINTSFNVRGEPIVRSPEDAVNCFLNTHMDYLVMGNYLLIKREMPDERVLNRKDYLEKFELD